MPTSTCNGVKIHYMERGSGPLLLLFHGVGGGAWIWQPQIEALSDSFRVVAWDARGYGESDDPPHPLTQRDFADDANALLDHLGVEQAHVCGNSMGGMIAQGFYQAYPHRVRSLILCDTMPGFGSLPNKDEILAERLNAIDSQPLAQVARERAPSLLADHPDAAHVALMAERMAQLRQEPYRQAWVAMFEVDYRGLLPKITVPTLIICGREDKVTPVAISEQLHGGIPGSQLYLMDGAGHISNIEKPEEFNTAVREFVQKVEASAG